MNVAQETLGFRRAGLSPALSLLMSAFALPIPPARVPPQLHRPTERSPTTQMSRRTLASLASVIGLSPVTSSAQDDSTSELLRFLQRMAASKPTSWLSKPSHLVSHLANHGG